MLKIPASLTFEYLEVDGTRYVAKREPCHLCVFGIRHDINSYHCYVDRPCRNHSKKIIFYEKVDLYKWYVIINTKNPILSIEGYKNDNPKHYDNFRNVSSSDYKNDRRYKAGIIPGFDLDGVSNYDTSIRMCIASTSPIDRTKIYDYLLADKLIEEGDEVRVISRYEATNKMIE